MAQNLYSRVKFIYAYGFFGAMKMLPFSVDEGSNMIVMRDACNSFLMNDELATIKFKYL